MKKIAFLTLQNREGFYIYDHLTYEPLRELGWNVTELAWDLPDVCWNDFEAVVIRSTWDYQNRIQEFEDTLAKIVESGVPVFNSPQVVAWNLSKTYLRTLAENDVPIPPTSWFDSAPSTGEIAELIAGWNTAELVIKPQIGANADDTFRLSSSNLHSGLLALAEIQLRFASRPCMVQPFFQTIVSEGEYSLVFFGNEFSHCIRKQPAKGDFRVQEEFGGSISIFRPDADMVRIASKALDLAPDPTLYARVDLIRSGVDSYWVTELELIEPSLYFPVDPASPRRFANAFHRLMQQS